MFLCPLVGPMLDVEGERWGGVALSRTMNSESSPLDSGGYDDQERAWERERETKEDVRDSGEEGVIGLG